MDTEDWMLRGGKRAARSPSPSRKRSAAKKVGGSAGSSIVSTLSTEGPKLLAPFGLLLARQGSTALGKRIRATKSTSGGDGGRYDMLRRASINGGGAPARTSPPAATQKQAAPAAKRSTVPAAKRSTVPAAKRSTAPSAAPAAKRSTASSAVPATAQKRAAKKEGGGSRPLQGKGRDRETERHIKEQFDMLVGGLGEILGGGSAVPRKTSAKKSNKK